jgi:hypothetical protein
MANQHYYSYYPDQWTPADKSFADIISDCNKPKEVKDDMSAVYRFISNGVSANYFPNTNHWTFE